MRELRELTLPRLVEARKRRSHSPEPEQTYEEIQTSRMSQASMTSDYSPVTPTFSLQGHSRFPSSSSSLASLPPMRNSFDDHASKRPLTEVREEPQEPHGDYEMRGTAAQSFPDPTPTAAATTPFPSLNDNVDLQADYDWVDGHHDNEELNFTVSKRRCNDRSPTTTEHAAARIGGGLRSLSHKLRSRKEKRISSIPDSFHESIASRSRASSIRAPSVADYRESMEYTDNRLPPMLSPAQSFTENTPIPDTPNSPIDTRTEPETLIEEEETEAAEIASRTPLLPPVMAILKTEEPTVQSPLQSPKISGSPRDPFDSPSAGSGLPSPPLSAKPSTSSFHRRQIVQQSDIPPMTLTDPQDEWANKLGHANFVIHPEPYLPILPATPASCRQLRADWDEARKNFNKHLARTREHHSATSKVYHLTELKWKQINSEWKRYNEQSLASVLPLQIETTDQAQWSSGQVSEPLTRMPSISTPQHEGKFPKIGESGIVGPMQVVKPATPPSSPVRKRGFWKFIQGMLPSSVALGRSNSAER